MLAANKNTDCVQHHKTHVDKRARARTSLWPHTHNETMRHQCPNPRHQTKTHDMSAGIQTPRSNMKQGTQTRERTDRARSKPYAHGKTGHDGSVRALSQNSWMTPDRSDRTLTLTPAPLKRDTTFLTGTPVNGQGGAGGAVQAGSSMPGGQGGASSLAGSKGGPGRTGSLGGAGRARSLGWAGRARSLGVKNKIVSENKTVSTPFFYQDTWNVPLNL